MRIFIQLDAIYAPSLTILEPLLLDLMGMFDHEPAHSIDNQHTIYLVSDLPKPNHAIAAE
jgi:hypothetical protein